MQPHWSNFSVCVTSHPVLASIVAGVGFILLIRAYIRLKVGVCHCDTSLVGKTVIITGANTGIGKETARKLAKQGARVILACRNPEKGNKAKAEIVESAGNKNVIFTKLDLCSFNSIREFSQHIHDTEQRVDILINNAGMFGTRKGKTTTDGWEEVLQANHLGHFLLTNLLLDLIKRNAPSRIINVSSAAYKFVVNDWDDLQNFLSYSQIKSYSQSKLANIHFTRELAKRLEGTGVTVNSLHPGAVQTDIIKSYSLFEIVSKIIVFAFGKNALEGAQTSIHLALSKDLEKVTGKYFTDCKEEQLSSIALDEKSAKRLWSLSENIVKLKS